MNGFEIEIAPHLTHGEMVCPDTVIAVYTLGLLKAWEKLRAHFNFPISIVKGGGYRTPEWNAAHGGAADSEHCRGNAIDPGISAFEKNGVEVYGKAAFFALLDCGFRGIGRYENRLHLDVRSEPTFWIYFLENGKLKNRPDIQAAEWFAEWNTRAENSI